MAGPHGGIDAEPGVAEDLHWADPTTVELLGLLATERIPGTMILITTRDKVEAPWASEVVDIALEPLGEKEAAGLVAALTEGGLDATQRRLIVERGDGVPLFLQELTRSAGVARPGEVLPPRIHEILTARLRAPGIDLRVAQLAATLGGEFDEEPLRQLAGRTSTQRCPAWRTPHSSSGSPRSGWDVIASGTI